MTCQWYLASGHRCTVNAIINMLWQGEHYARLCGAHGSAAKRLWPQYKYKARRKKRALIHD